MAEVAVRKLRVLCVHGYAQDGPRSFRGRTGALRKALKALADFEYVTAPHALPPREEGGEVKGYTWWRANEVDGVMRYGGWDATLETLHAAAGGQPFDGVLGFSQGAAVVGMLCAMREELLRGDATPDTLPPLFRFRFAVLASGFPARDPKLRETLQGGASAPTPWIRVPSLHIIGEADELITPEWSGVLAANFVAPRFHKHAGGHFLPTDAASRALYKQFVAEHAARDEAKL